jgi:hypothetical protein
MKNKYMLSFREDLLAAVDANRDGAETVGIVEGAE